MDKDVEMQDTEYLTSSEFIELLNHLSVDEILGTEYCINDKWSKLLVTNNAKKCQVCNLCNVEMSSTKVIKEHLGGKKHKQKCSGVSDWFHPLYTAPKKHVANKNIMTNKTAAAAPPNQPKAATKLKANNTTNVTIATAQKNSTNKNNNQKGITLNKKEAVITTATVNQNNKNQKNIKPINNSKAVSKPISVNSNTASNDQKKNSVSSNSDVTKSESKTNEELESNNLDKSSSSLQSDECVIVEKNQSLIILSSDDDDESAVNRQEPKPVEQNVKIKEEPIDETNVQGLAPDTVIAAKAKSSNSKAQLPSTDKVEQQKPVSNENQSSNPRAQPTKTAQNKVTPNVQGRTATVKQNQSTKPKSQAITTTQVTNTANVQKQTAITNQNNTSIGKKPAATNAKKPNAIVQGQKVSGNQAQSSNSKSQAPTTSQSSNTAKVQGKTTHANQSIPSNPKVQPPSTAQSKANANIQKQAVVTNQNKRTATVAFQNKDLPQKRVNVDTASILQPNETALESAENKAVAIQNNSTLKVEIDLPDTENVRDQEEIADQENVNVDIASDAQANKAAQETAQNNAQQDDGPSSAADANAEERTDIASDAQANKAAQETAQNNAQQDDGPSSAADANAEERTDIASDSQANEAAQEEAVQNNAQQDDGPSSDADVNAEETTDIASYSQANEAAHEEAVQNNAQHDDGPSNTVDANAEQSTASVISPPSVDVDMESIVIDDSEVVLIEDDSDDENETHSSFGQITTIISSGNNTPSKPHYQSNFTITPRVPVRANKNSTPLDTGSHSNQINDSFQEASSVQFITKSLLDSNVHGLLGVEYVVKIIKHRKDRPPTYECGLCKVSMDGPTMQKHLVGYTHRLKYCEIHFPTAIKQYRTFMVNIPEHEIFKVMAIVLHKLAVAIEEHHGRNLPFECTETEHMTNRTDIMLNVHSFKHASEKNGPTFTHVIDTKEIDVLIKNRNQLKPNIPSSNILFDDNEQKIQNEFTAGQNNRQDHRQKLQTNFSTRKEILRNRTEQAVQPLDNETHKAMVEKFLQKNNNRLEPTEFQQTQGPITFTNISTAVPSYQTPNYNYNQPHVYSNYGGNVNTFQPYYPQTNYGMGYNQPMQNSYNSNFSSNEHHNFSNYAINFNNPHTPTMPAIDTRKRHQSRSPSPSPPHKQFHHSRDVPDSVRWQKYKNMVDFKTVELQKIYDIYKHSPEQHPLYRNEWKKFWKSKKDELISKGIDHTKYDFQPDWVRFFEARINNLYNDELEAIKIECREKLLLPNTNEHLNEQKYHVRGNANSDRGIPAKDSLSASSAVHRNENPSNSKESKNKSDISVISVLRLLAALEEHLGVLGPKIVNLLSKTLQLEKINPSNINNLLFTVENTMLLETAKEKFKGLLAAGFLDASKERALKKAVDQTESLLEMIAAAEQANKINKDNDARTSNQSQRNINEIQSNSQAQQLNTRVSNNYADVLAQADKKELAAKLASSLSAQGQTGIDQENLQQLIAVYALLEKKKQAASLENNRTNDDDSARQIAQTANTMPSNNFSNSTFSSQPTNKTIDSNLNRQNDFLRNSNSNLRNYGTMYNNNNATSYNNNPINTRTINQNVNSAYGNSANPSYNNSKTIYPNANTSSQNNAMRYSNALNSSVQQQVSNFCNTNASQYTASLTGRGNVNPGNNFNYRTGSGPEYRRNQ